MEAGDGGPAHGEMPQGGPTETRVSMTAARDQATANRKKAAATLKFTTLRLCCDRDFRLWCGMTSIPIHFSEALRYWDTLFKTQAGVKELLLRFSSTMDVETFRKTMLGFTTAEFAKTCGFSNSMRSPREIEDDMVVSNTLWSYVINSIGSSAVTMFNFRTFPCLFVGLRSRDPALQALAKERMKLAFEYLEKLEPLAAINEEVNSFLKSLMFPYSQWVREVFLGYYEAEWGSCSWAE